MTVIRDVVLNTGRLTRGLGEMMLAGIEADRFARQPNGANGLVDTNHPAFVYGHLSIYPAKLLAATGGDPGQAATPDGFDALFEAGVDCQDDPEGSIYPSMETITSAYFRGTDALLAHLIGVDERVWGQENPTERARDRLPTVGALIEFLVGPHSMMHFGQVSAWRRMEGLGPCM
ncbi:MAG: DinB family protein [Planctomycetota bacterium]